MGLSSGLNSTDTLYTKIYSHNAPPETQQNKTFAISHQHAIIQKEQLNMDVFRAGCNSRPAVKSASASALNWFDSNTDSKVWMKEDVLIEDHLEYSNFNT